MTNPLARSQSQHFSKKILRGYRARGGATPATASPKKRSRTPATALADEAADQDQDQPTPTKKGRRPKKVQDGVDDKSDASAGVRKRAKKAAAVAPTPWADGSSENAADSAESHE